MQGFALLLFFFFLFFGEITLALCKRIVGFSHSNTSIQFEDKDHRIEYFRSWLRTVCQYCYCRTTTAATYPRSRWRVFCREFDARIFRTLL